MKISIVTPVYNGEKYIRQTIESVLAQKGDFEVEYLVMDGGSTDTTVRIAYEYISQTKNGFSFSIVSEKDSGMYDAINRGFAKATGDIYAYINSDDVYESGAFASIASVLEKYPDIEWLKGISSIIDQSSKISRTLPCYIYNRSWIEKGIYGRNAPFIQQESVFWRSSLWKKAGPIDESLRLAGDYYLWLRFAKLSSLWTINKKLAKFRILETQLSQKFIRQYREEQLSISKQKGFLSAVVKLFFWSKSVAPRSWNGLFLLLYRMIFRNRNTEYIDFENDRPIKKKAYSFIA